MKFLEMSFRKLFRIVIVAVFYIITLAIFIFTICYWFWGIFSTYESMSIIVLDITAFAIGQQAFSTSKIVEYEQKPIVDVCIIKRRNEEGSRFQILNLSRTPARVWIEIYNKERMIREDSFRIGLMSIVTNPDYLTDEKIKKIPEETKIKMGFSVRPAYDEEKPKTFEYKNYTYRNDRWENELGMPDPDLVPFNRY